MPLVSDRPLVILTEYLDAEPIEWLSQRVELVRCAPDDAAFNGLLARAAGLIIRTYTIVDAAMLNRAPQLRVVGRAGVGLDNVDLDACGKRAIAVVNTPDANTQAVVEYVTANLTDALRPRAPLDTPEELAGLDAAAWARRRDGAIVERQMSEMILGILGYGRIGRRIAEVASAIGFQVHINDIEPIEAIDPGQRHGATPVDLETLLRQSDVLTIHIDGRASNHKFINADRIKLLKPTVLLLNTSRGSVLDAAALAAFLKVNPQASAIIDVHDPEPIPPGAPLLTCQQACLYPHLASRTRQAQANMSWVVRDVARVLEA